MLPALSQAQYVPQYKISTFAGTYTAPSSTTLPTCPGTSVGDGGAATSAQLCGPSGLAFDSSGNLYIADSNNNRIRKISGTTISTAAGNGTGGFAGDNGSATSAELNAPSGIAFDSSGNVFIADSQNYEVRKVSGNNISTVAGQNSQGSGYTNSQNLGPATSARLGIPSSVAVDSAGNFYIADPPMNIVRVVCQNQTPLSCTQPYFGSLTFAAGDINVFAGNQASGAFYSGDGGPAYSALLNNPTGVTLDSAGNLYIADSGNNAIRKVTPNGTINTVAGNGQPGYSGDGGQAIQAMLNTPKAVAVDSNNNLYIADYNNSVIRMVEPNGIITTIAGNVSLGPGYSGDGGAATSAQLFNPGGIAVHGGNIYVSDTQNNLIRMLTPQAAVPQVNAGGVVNGASFSAPVAAGSIASVFGDFFLTSTLVDTTLPLQVSMSELSFQFGGSTAAPLFFVSGGQVNVQVPWELAGQTTSTLAATLNGSTGTAQSVKLATFAPAIFSQNSQGTGAGAILDSAFHLVDSSNPAVAGNTTILIYCTGLGPVSENQPASGQAASTDSTKLAHTSTLPTVTIGGVTAEVTFSGLAPGYVGLYQVNATVPAGVASNSAAPVVISIGGANSNTVTIPVQ